MASVFPMPFLKHRVYIAGVLSATMIGFPYFVILYNLPIRFQVVNEMSALSAGIGLLPMLGSTAVGSMIGGIISGKKNRTFRDALRCHVLHVPWYWPALYLVSHTGC